MGVERRLEFIEFRLYWEGGINRSDIIEMFDISVPKASKDLTLYQERAPQNAIYDKSAKRYVASEQFLPNFLRPDPGSYLSRLRSLAEGLTGPDESWISNRPEADTALTPRRQLDSGVLRVIIRAMRMTQSLEIYYQSMSKERVNPVWRRMTPHAFAYDDFRWHVRAYCHIDQQFKDFLLPRILSVRNPGEPGASPVQDWQWHETFEVEIGPHPGSTSNQKAIVAKDFDMKGGRAVLTVRYCMFFYVLKRLGLLGDARSKAPILSTSWCSIARRRKTH